MQVDDLIADRFVLSLVDGDPSVEEVVQQLSETGVSIEAVTPALLAAERATAASALDGQVPVSGKVISDRLDVLLSSVTLSSSSELPAEVPAGTIALVRLAGSVSSVGHRVWHALLTAHGYDVRELDSCDAVDAARHLIALSPDAVGLYVDDAPGSEAAQLLVLHLLSLHGRVPVLIGGPGVDEAFARRISVSNTGAHYWAGVYYCENVTEALQVLKQIVLYEPPPQTHTHDHGHEASVEADGCDSCCDCVLSDACDMPVTSGV